MPTYVAFLRAINLGPTRKFPKADIVRVVEATGATDVVTHINTGNVRLTTTLRSRPKVERTLEEAFAADRGFAVPTIVFSPAEVVAIAADADELAVGHEGRQYVSLLKEAPSAAGVAAIEGAGSDGQRAVVRGRAVHLLLGPDYHTASLTNEVVEKHLGVATNRNVTVIRALSTKWGA
ncbi:DUF1697 domain-containing protein [Nocardioides euryhalodurans]|uniref:DUF1697 domain-containing protein n=1 Tax=Nocardioides euryhalodurans TaxID=2518370 RepID=A0A4P7GP02_9ACTN|nr:DUF1697 domain-containing protein [Nocardioides euryhalodurans]QBR93823.1 DUF1697 domain-containing protein [Nocardioides euryhalodurans]